MAPRDPLTVTGSDGTRRVHAVETAVPLERCPARGGGPSSRAVARSGAKTAAAGTPW
ncbi:hypothetical protein [Dactylosporangium sp. NPDC050588]|uniref:hypothetical protein n=1 Tax=Dactylosporangium sp. NPDC050588 TaxID=3157211 RepID=UPI0033CADBD7